MTVEIRTNVNHSGEGVPIDDRVFHFCCFGNFSGSDEKRSFWEPMPVNRNSWDQLFEQLKPSVKLYIELPSVDDLQPTLHFDSLRSFSEKGVTTSLPILASLKALEIAVGKASKEAPLNLKACFGDLPDNSFFNTLKGIAGDSGQDQAIDLLSMVDIGEEDENEANLPETARFLDCSVYTGENRARLAAELVGLRRQILDQVWANPAFARLHACWRALKYFVTIDSISLSLIDCGRQEWCDATFSNFVKPDSGAPRPLDLAFYCDDLAYGEDDRHIAYHLGRMGEFLMCPLILNVAPALFGCKVWGHLSHLRDIGGRMSRPELIKWRKLRDEPGSVWLFLAVNPFRLDHEEADDALTQIAVPPSFYLALLVAESLKDGKWPGELLHPGFQLPIANRCLARLDEEQGYDLSFEGFCALTGKENGDRLHLLGMMSLAGIKIPMGQSLAAAGLVEYSLAYRFYVGNLSRFLQDNADNPDLLEKLSAHGGLSHPDAIVVEEEDGQRIFRIRPPFTIFGEQPDIILAV